MKYREFEEMFAQYKIFTTNDLLLHDPNFQLSQLTRWKKAGYIYKLKRGIWIFTNQLNKLGIYPYIANRLLEHSYLSLERALGRYGITPEAVITYTSICTHRTDSFLIGDEYFTYHKIKPTLFFGYTIHEHQGMILKIGKLEKVILDFLYLHPDIREEEDFEEMRFNSFELQDGIDSKTLLLYASQYPQIVQKTAEKLYQRYSKHA